MKKTTKQWISYAKEDLGISHNLFENTDYFKGCIYHCQQCMEKILKAMLIELDIKVIRTHNLDIIFNKLPKELKKQIEISKEELEAFNEIYLSSKYPTDIGQLPSSTPQKSDAKYFLDIAEKTLNQVTSEIDKLMVK